STLTPVVVSATPASGATGDAMDPDQIRQTTGTTLGTVLQSVDGIHSSTFGGGSSRPVVRGQDGPRIPVLASGTELMAASSVSPDHAVDTEPALTDSIEILRGPGALRYDAATSGTVINIEDDRIPTEVPARGVEGTVDLSVDTGSRQRNGAVSLTAG